MTDWWRRVEALFHRAVDLDPEERARIIEEGADGDETLRAEVESLIDAEGLEDPIERVIGDAAHIGTRAEGPPGYEGEWLGPYLLKEKIGEGGMGSVYLAERADDQYRATVAVKILRGLSTADAVERFRRERQILADLTHPNIARLLDGGTTPAGLPYVVMEYIEGEPIHQYCDRKSLTVRQRVELFRGVARAVEYAHSRLVVHRDIKPSNILVTAAGEPKLLDFGIAKSLTADGMSTTAAMTVTTTASMVRVLTPAYASPEQVRGDTITVASDVYGLGAVLYELLTGSALHRFKNTTPAELERVICEEMPASLPRAAALAAVGNDDRGHELARLRGATSSRELARELSGDLENIVGTALRKEPERRYASVERLSDDLLRYLDGRPVTARADEWSYRAGKFIGRHRFAVGTAAVFVLSLLAFSVVITVQNARISEQRDLAEERRIAAEEVTNFLVDAFQSSDPNESRGNVVTVREVLDRSTERIATLSDQPAIRASLEETMGTVYKNLGLYDEARPLLVSALDARRRLHGNEHRDVAGTLFRLAEYEFDAGDYERSMALYQESLTIYRTLDLADSDEAASALDGLATVLDAEGRYDEAERAYREALALRRALHGDVDTRVASVIQNLSATLRTKGAFEEAERLNRESLATRREVLGNDHLDTAHSLNQLARLLTLQGRHDEALPLAKEGLAIRRAAHRGEPHAELAASLGNVAGILSNLGHTTEALTHRRESLETLEALFGSEHPYVAASLSSLGRAQFDLGRVDEAEVSLRRSVALHHRLFPDGNPDSASPLTSLGIVLMSSNRLDEAQRALSEALALRTEHLPPDHWLISTSQGLLGECLSRKGDVAEGGALLRASVKGLEAAFGPDDPRAEEARARVSTYLDGEAPRPEGG